MSLAGRNQHFIGTHVLSSPTVGQRIHEKRMTNRGSADVTQRSSTLADTYQKRIEPNFKCAQVPSLTTTKQRSHFTTSHE